MRRLIFTLALLLGAVAAPAFAGSCPAYPYTLVNGQLADANQVMSDFNNVRNCFINNGAANSANSDITSLIRPYDAPECRTGRHRLDDGRRGYGGRPDPWRHDRDHWRPDLHVTDLHRRECDRRRHTGDGQRLARNLCQRYRDRERQGPRDDGDRQPGRQYVRPGANHPGHSRTGDRRDRHDHCRLPLPVWPHNKVLARTGISPFQEA